MEETIQLSGRCFVCRTSEPLENLENLTEEIVTKRSQRSYYEIIQSLMSHSIEFTFQDRLCMQCITIIEEIDDLFYESRLLSQIMRRLLQKKFSTDEEEIEVDTDEVVFELFQQKKSKFLCLKCDFVGNNFEILSAHYKYHEIRNRQAEVILEFGEDMKPDGGEEELEAFEEEGYEVVKGDEATEEYLDPEPEFEDGGKGDKTEKIEIEDSEIDETQEVQEESVEIKYDDDSKNRFCHLCSKTFKNNQNLQYHMLSHTKNFKHFCKYCGKGCKHETQLKVHENTHTKSKTFDCNLCPKVFLSADHLNRHKKWHANPLPFDCPAPDCGMRFRAKTHMTNHFARKHSTEKNFQCSVEGCGKRFATKANLTTHLKNHSTNYSHPCKLCSSGYHSRRGLIRHLKREHQGVSIEEHESSTGGPMKPSVFIN